MKIGSSDIIKGYVGNSEVSKMYVGSVSVYEASSTQPDDEIWYTSTDGNVVTPYTTSGFGANIVSNTYSEGKGIIKFDDAVTTIPQNGFKSKTTLNTIFLPNSVTEMKFSAFIDCSGMREISICSGITTLSYEMFRGCTSLSGFSGSYTGISSDGRCLMQGSTLKAVAPYLLTSLVIPSGVTAIEEYALYSLQRITAVTIPEGVTTIGYNAFYWCKSLTAITIPSTITSIGAYSFYYCTGATSITCTATTPPSLGGYAFDNSTCPIYVPSESVETYISAAGWSTYADRIQAIPE